MRNLNIYSRILLLAFMSIALFAMLFGTLHLIKLNQQKRVIAASQEQLDKEIDAVLKLNSASLKQVVFDYTFWNEFVRQIERKPSYDMYWFQNNISTILSSFHYDYVAVYDASGKQIIENRSGLAPSASFVTPEILKAIHQQRFLNFFVNSSDGLMEVSAATVHEDTDPQHNKTAPRGYLVLGRIWNKPYLSNIAQLTGSQVVLVSPDKKQASTNEQIILSESVLRDWKQVPCQKIVFTRYDNLISLYNEIAHIIMIVIASFAVISLLLYSIFIRKWVSQPFRLLSKVIQSEDGIALDALRDAPGEFRKLGNMMKNYIEQKEELRKAKEHAENSDNLKSEFLRNMSHEVRTPMNAIMGFSQLLTEDEYSADEKKEFAKTVYTSSKYLLRIVSDILDMSHLDANQVYIRPMVVNVNHMLSQIHLRLNNKATKKNLKLEIRNELTAEQNLVETDSVVVTKILTNLTRNAIKFTDSGFVMVGCRVIDNKIYFYVRDTGIGIEQGNIKRIFERFAQADKKIAFEYGGLGLGLSIAAEYARLMGATISVQSVPGEGSLFGFSIPFVPIDEAIH